MTDKGAFKYYISDEGGEGGLTSIAYVAYAFRGWGVPEQNAYVILELFVLPLDYRLKYA